MYLVYTAIVEIMLVCRYSFEIYQNRLQKKNKKKNKKKQAAGSVMCIHNVIHVKEYNVSDVIASQQRHKTLSFRYIFLSALQSLQKSRKLSGFCSFRISFLRLLIILIFLSAETRTSTQMYHAVVPTDHSNQGSTRGLKFH